MNGRIANNQPVLSSYKLMVLSYAQVVLQDGRVKETLKKV